MTEQVYEMELTEEEFDVIATLLDSEEAEDIALKHGEAFHGTFLDLREEYHEKVA